MEIDLLRKLAQVDPEIPLFFEQKPHGTVINLKRPFNRYLTLPSDQDAIDRWCERLFFALLDRIKARGLEPTIHLQGDSWTVFLYTSENQTYATWTSKASSLPEALAKAYIAALEVMP